MCTPALTRRNICITGNGKKVGRAREGAERLSFSFSKAHGESRVAARINAHRSADERLKGLRGSIVCASVEADESERLTSLVRLTFPFTALAMAHARKRDPSRGRYSIVSRRRVYAYTSTDSNSRIPRPALDISAYVSIPVTLLGHCCNQRGNPSASVSRSSSAP